MRIQRHVEEHCPAASDQGARTGFNPLPIIAPRLIEVNMRINHARKNVQSVRLDLLPRVAGNISDCDNTSISDGDVRNAFAFVRHYRSAANDEIKLVHDCELDLC